MAKDYLKDSFKKDKVDQEPTSKLVVDVDSKTFHEFKVKCLQSKKTMREVVNDFINEYLKSN